MTDVYDVAIIGGGVTGCATVSELTNHGFACILLEQHPHLLAEVSSGNSGMLHTGFDTVEGTMESECIRRSQRRIYDTLDKLTVPVQHIGATMVAWSQEHLDHFPALLHRCRRFGIYDLTQLSASDLYRREPFLCPGALGAVYIPGESVTDPWLLPISLMNEARRKGAKVLTSATVNACHRTSSENWCLETSRGPVMARTVVNCAGLHGDKVDKMADNNHFRIQPIKGQYNIHTQAAKHLLQSSILPVPSKVGKGIIVFRSVYDHVVVGPTADPVPSWEDANVDDVTSQRLLNVAKRTVTSLDKYDVVARYRGVRPATQFKDYVIKGSCEKSWITVGGIRSTGLSGCLGIGEIVRELLIEHLNLEPTQGRDSHLSKPDVTFTRHGTAILDGIEHQVTHPLTRLGKCGSPSAKL